MASVWLVMSGGLVMGGGIVMGGWLVLSGRFAMNGRIVMNVWLVTSGLPVGVQQPISLITISASVGSASVI